ncbi:MAG: TVP38/TMEM64 family protein [Mogibacterium sp.]|nr:TVP38/TMEM64 family protein [Mogibacterium sp.]
MKNSKRSIAVIKILLLAVIVIGIPVYLYFSYGSELFSSDVLYRLEDYLNLHRSESALILIGLQIVQVIICILPGQPIQFASSYMFGILGGFLLSITGALIGVTISFYIAKFLGKDFLEIVFDADKIENYRRKLNSGKGLLIVLLIYLLPGVPKDLVSYAAGISDMRFRPFLLVSTIGRSPGMLGSLLLGHFFSERNYTAIAVLAVITVIILVICLIKRRSILELLDRIEARETQRLEVRDGEETEDR